jgi:hypothetical protein
MHIKFCFETDFLSSMSTVKVDKLAVVFQSRLPSRLCGPRTSAAHDCCEILAGDSEVADHRSWSQGDETSVSAGSDAVVTGLRDLVSCGLELQRIQQGDWGEHVGPGWSSSSFDDTDSR